MREYLACYALKEAPFSKEIADSELWMPPSKQLLVDELVEAIHERHSVALTGEPGIGKTCVLRALRNSLDSAVFRFTYCHNVTVGRRDFYRQLCIALGIPKGMTAGEVFLAVSTHVEDLSRERLFPVFLVDEAHLLHQDTLDHLHILLNYAWDSKALLSLILVGLPELDERLRRRRNRSLYSRLHHRLALGPLSPDDTADYIKTRLARAGCTKELFTADAIAMLHEATSGSLRDIDRIAHHALRISARRKRKLVERDVISQILKSEGELNS
jgi:type II secretory pathway predicted ATPase ExeA